MRNEQKTFATSFVAVPACRVGRAPVSRTKFNTYERGARASVLMAQSAIAADGASLDRNVIPAGLRIEGLAATQEPAAARRGRAAEFGFSRLQNPDASIGDARCKMWTTVSGPVGY